MSSTHPEEGRHVLVVRQCGREPDQPDQGLRGLHVSLRPRHDALYDCAAIVGKEVHLSQTHVESAKECAALCVSWICGNSFVQLSHVMAVYVDTILCTVLN